MTPASPDEAAYGAAVFDLLTEAGKPSPLPVDRAVVDAEALPDWLAETVTDAQLAILSGQATTCEHANRPGERLMIPAWSPEVVTCWRRPCVATLPHSPGRCDHCGQPVATGAWVADGNAVVLLGLCVPCRAVPCTAGRADPGPAHRPRRLINTTRGIKIMSPTHWQVGRPSPKPKPKPKPKPAKVKIPPPRRPTVSQRVDRIDDAELSRRMTLADPAWRTLDAGRRAALAAQAIGVLHLTAPSPHTAKFYAVAQPGEHVEGGQVLRNGRWMWAAPVPDVDSAAGVLADERNRCRVDALRFDAMFDAVQAIRAARTAYADAVEQHEHATRWRASALAAGQVLDSPDPAEPEPGAFSPGADINELFNAAPGWVAECVDRLEAVERGERVPDPGPHTQRPVDPAETIERTRRRLRDVIVGRSAAPSAPRPEPPSGGPDAVALATARGRLRGLLTGRT